MLREARDAGFERRRWRWELWLGSTPVGLTWSGRAMRALRERAAVAPAVLLRRGDRALWWFEDRFWWADDDLHGGDVLALVRERERRGRRRLERAHAALAGETRTRRRDVVPRPVRQAVWERDGGRCVQCGADFELQFDHVIPVALGGASTVENLQVLCGPCNRAKGAALA
jgi:5-methylcytosine-specific restriction endonuclease McrA